MYDGDTAQVLRDSCLALVHPSACLCAAARCVAGVCHLATMTGNMSSARKCPGCSWLRASLTTTGAAANRAQVHRLCQARFDQGHPQPVSRSLHPEPGLRESLCCC